MKALVVAFMCAWVVVATAEQPRDLPRVAPVVETPDMDRKIREIIGEPDLEPARGPYFDALLALTVLVAALILLSGLDDLFIDLCYWTRRRRREAAPPLAAMLERPEAPFAIMVPAWKESDVIAAMIQNTLATLQYAEYRIFCGVYPNDPATAREVDRMALRHPGRVVRVDVPHDGPTCKADCLNAIAQRVLREERATGRTFAGLVLHDSEDVIHPLELKLFNAVLPGKALVQLPVFSLERKWTDFTAGTYIDDFAESHGKDIRVREELIGVVPGAGVATAYSRDCVMELWRRSGGQPFNTATLTEDYELSFRLKALGMAQTFANVRLPDGPPAPGVRGRTARIVSTHEYFPDRFRAAYRQRARWVLGIAFQGWRQLRWQGTMLERYFFFRDRKAMVMAPACAAAYLLLANFVLGMTLGAPDWRLALESMLSSPLLQAVLTLNLAFMANRALQRMIFVGRYYGPLQAALSVARMPVNNAINFFAVMRAWRQFLGHLATGKKLAWDKTAHAFPDVQHLAMAARTVLLASLLGACFMTDARAAPPELTGRAYELADQAYKALEANQPERALQLASSALRLAPGHASLLLIEADALERMGRHEEAVARIAGLSPSDLGGVGLAQRGYLRLGSGDAGGGKADLQAALASGELGAEERANVEKDLAALAEPAAEREEPVSATNGGSELADRGYKALAAGDSAGAVRDFRAALATGTLGAAERASVSADAGWAAMHLGRNKEAVSLLSGAIDEWHAAPAGQKPFDDQSLYDMRRSIDSMERRWGGSFSIGHNTTRGIAGSGLTAGASDLRVLQAGGELYYQPESYGYRDGRIFQWYANAFQALSTSDADYPTGSDSRVVSLGARYKPLRETNLVVGLERRLAAESAGEDDWVAHVGWSGSRATDWDPRRTSWTTWQAYTETFYFIRNARLIQPFDLRAGRSYKLPVASAVLTPYVGIAGDYDRALDPSFAAGAGPGVSLRYWFGETRYRAFARYIDLSVQYRWALTDAHRASGLFFLGTISF